MADSKAGSTKPSALLSMAAGAFAGGVEAILTYPTECVKRRSTVCLSSPTKPLYPQIRQNADAIGK